MKKFLAILLLIISICFGVYMVILSITFDQKCGGYLKQVADANTIELALDRINKAIDYIEAKHLTSGYTSIIYKTEDENIGFWYNNIIACRNELESAINTTQLEQTNVLMKVRESLIDTVEGDTVLTIPQGICRYPNNLLFAILSFMAIIMCIGAPFIYCME